MQAPSALPATAGLDDIIQEILDLRYPSTRNRRRAGFSIHGLLAAYAAAQNFVNRSDCINSLEFQMDHGQTCRCLFISRIKNPELFGRTPPDPLLYATEALACYDRAIVLADKGSDEDFQQMGTAVRTKKVTLLTALGGFYKERNQPEQAEETFAAAETIGLELLERKATDKFVLTAMLDLYMTWKQDAKLKTLANRCYRRLKEADTQLLNKLEAAFRELKMYLEAANCGNSAARSRSGVHRVR